MADAGPSSELSTSFIVANLLDDEVLLTTALLVLTRERGFGKEARELICQHSIALKLGNVEEAMQEYTVVLQRTDLADNHRTLVENKLSEQVKAAEADAESKYLSGIGVARQRQAIVNGLQAKGRTSGEDGQQVRVLQ